MPETRQIGRQSMIEALETRVTGATHQWLIGERRIGKTSVAKAVLARVRKKGAVALDVDLSKLSIISKESLAGDIARQAQAAHAGEGTERSRRWLEGIRGQRRNAKLLGDTLGKLGFEDEGQALTAVAALLAGADDGSAGLDDVLGALALHARATGRRACLLLDEVHLLKEIPEADSNVARWCRESDCPIIFILAGSEESAARALREPGRPLAPVGHEFQLTDIATEDWIHGLGQRFREAGVEIGPGEVEAIVAASQGHPRRTMLICSNIHSMTKTQPDDVATMALVNLAIQDSQRDRAWR